LNSFLKEARNFDTQINQGIFNFQMIFNIDDATS